MFPRQNRIGFPDIDDGGNSGTQTPGAAHCMSVCLLLLLVHTGWFCGTFNAVGEFDVNVIKPLTVDCAMQPAQTSPDLGFPCQPFILYSLSFLNGCNQCLFLALCVTKSISVPDTHYTFTHWVMLSC